MKKQLNGNFYFIITNLSLISYDKALQIYSNYLDAWNNKGIALNN